MDVKQELEKVRFLSGEVDALMTEINKADQITAIETADSGKCKQYREQLQKNVVELINRKVKLMDAINRIPDIEYQIVLVKRYFEGLSYDDIALDLNRRKRWAEEMNRKAIEELRKVTGNM